MHPHGNYLPNDKMCDLICENYTLLQVLSRFELPLGFGEKTVEEVCRENGVDCSTFLSVVNFILDGCTQMAEDPGQISVPSLMAYLQQSHHYFLDFYLPFIRRKLIEAIDCSSENKIAYLILRFYDEYVGEVRKHMDYEDENVFTYVEALLSGQRSEHYRISTFARRHGAIDAKLTELKNIIIKYYPEKEKNLLLNAVLQDIFSCEQELSSHCKVEDLLFIPAVTELERKENETK
ncbi:MAG: hemerythrin domain-containing protein [Bacteroidaceae bacterium]|jgi:regulator of cell morphogenesis and NO signaling